MRMPPNGLRWLGTGLIISFIIGIPMINYLDWRISSKEKTPWSLFTTDPSHSMLVSWESINAGPSYVRFGTNPADLDQISSDPEFTTMHHVLLTGLNPGTKYFYQIGLSPESTPNFGTDFTFTSAPIGIDTDFNFTVISDTQQMFWGNGYTRRITSILSALDTAFVTIVGDMVDDGSDQANWDDFFEQFDRLFAKMPLVPIAGNHDGDINSFFPISTNPDYFFYSFNYSMVHFTILHVYSDEKWNSGAIQQAWLVQDLIVSQSMPFRIVLMHCPVIGSGFFSNRATGLRSQLLPLLQSYHVQLLLTGHDHHYERISEGNLTMITTGGGGALLDPFVLMHPDTDRIAFSPNYLHIYANASHLEVKSIGLDNMLIDRMLILN